MGWEDYHLHAFEVGWDRYGDGEGRAETAVTVGGVLPNEGGRMGYRYDFGDCWDHIIEVEKIHRPHPGTTYPRCSAGRRACPPEDAGGVYGYADMLKALRARKGPRYREIKEWLNGPYDPEAFDLIAINEALAEHSVSRAVNSSTDRAHPPAMLSRLTFRQHSDTGHNASWSRFGSPASMAARAAAPMASGLTSSLARTRSTASRMARLLPALPRTSRSAAR